MNLEYLGGIAEYEHITQHLYRIYANPHGLRSIHNKGVWKGASRVWDIGGWGSAVLDNCANKALGQYSRYLWEVLGLPAGIIFSFRSS